MSGVHGYSKTDNRRRYYRHQKLKQEKGIRLDARNRTIFTGLGFEIDQNRHISALVKKFGYAVQVLAFYPPPITDYGSTK